MARPHLQLVPPSRSGRVSFWFDAVGIPAPEDVLDGDRATDVCIVGGGFTGLWTAYYLSREQPGLRIAVVEERFAGFGASGRNGGWLSALLPCDREALAREHGRDAVRTLQRVQVATVAEVLARLDEERIDADVAHGGVLKVATSEPQRARLRHEVDEDLAWGLETHLLSQAESRDRINVNHTVAGAWSPHCARIQPAKLVRGLAATVRAHGVRIHEGTRATSIGPGRVETTNGTISAPIVLRATEGFTPRLPGLQRSWLPMNSSMIVTEPLPQHVWQEIGWSLNETLADEAHAYIYAQRTADGRIAIGGRGHPYRYGSKTDLDGDTPASTVASLRAALVRLFPTVREIPVARAWSGVLAVPRDWCATVGFDRASGTGWAGGYIGDGVATSNLMGRTLTDLALGRTSELTTLPWVGRQAKLWEREPLRWLGVQTVYAGYRLADRQETRTGRPSPAARAAAFLAGR